MTGHPGPRTPPVGGSRRLSGTHRARASHRSRLDTELVRRGLARSREHAAELIVTGRVEVAGAAAAKPATQVTRDAPITVTDVADESAYVSRGGHKLAGALAAFGGSGGLPGGVPPEPPEPSEPPGQHCPRLTVAGRRCLDAGASTGGFTDVLLRAGAAHVVAVDVGYGQLAWPLRTDPRVTTLDRLNVRSLRPEQVTVAGGPPEFVVADLSFISLRLVLPALVACATGDADFVLLVKPQFEVGRERVGRGGVVRDTQARAAAVAAVCDAAAALGLGVCGVTASPLPGPAGNVEYFVWLRHGAAPLGEADLRRAIQQGPR